VSVVQKACGECGTESEWRGVVRRACSERREQAMSVVQRASDECGAESKRRAAAAVAIGYAGHNVLKHLYKGDQAALRRALNSFRARIREIIADRELIGKARRWGALVAKKVVADRNKDGYRALPPFLDFDDKRAQSKPGEKFQHQPDPTEANTRDVQQVRTQGCRGLHSQNCSRS
jgi:hypothetical protein